MVASQRMVNTNFWKDTYVIDLDPIEKLLFLYLITNPRTNIAGIYEISLREIAFDTGIDKDMVQKILSRFAIDKKVYYSRGWLALNNWIKHQSLNPKVSAGIMRIIDELPEWLRNELIDVDNPQTNLLELGITEPIHSLSKPIALNLTKLNLTQPNLTQRQAENSKKESESQIDKKVYARAVRADEEQAERVKNSRTRSGEGYKSFTKVGEVLKGKKHEN